MRKHCFKTFMMGTASVALWRCYADEAGRSGRGPRTHSTRLPAERSDRAHAVLLIILPCGMESCCNAMRLCIATRPPWRRRARTRARCARPPRPSASAGRSARSARATRPACSRRPMRWAVRWGCRKRPLPCCRRRRAACVPETLAGWCCVAASRHRVWGGAGDLHLHYNSSGQAKLALAAANLWVSSA